MNEEPSIYEIFSPGSTLQIEFTNDSGTRVIIKTTVENLDDNQLVLSIPKWDDAIANQKSGNRIALICKIPNQQNDYVFATQYINSEFDSATLTVTRPSTSNFWKGRRFFRCDVNKVSISYFHHNKEYRDNQVVNLSSSGLFSLFDYTHEFSLGMEVTCRISLPNIPNPFLFVGKVVRTQNYADKQGVAFHFNFPSPALQSQITKFLFTCQQTMVRQGRVKLLA